MKPLARGSALLVAVAVPMAAASPAVADPGGTVANKYVTGYAKKDKVKRARLAKPTPERPNKPQPASNTPPVFEHRLTLACGSNRVRSVSGTDDVANCSYALKACQYRTPPSNEPLYYIWQRKKSPANSPWQIVGDTCGTRSAPVAAPPPPPVPTLAQIQQAFKRLPFSKPTVRIEPRGNVTLVNLPTYYEATWPDDTGLQPGEISQPVQLLSWSVEFKISSRSYTFHYGDGTSSGEVEDAGGGYPDGAIRHTYGKPIEAAKVTVDSRLTGQFRVNGGTWIDIDTIADLQDEPATTLAVKESKARLYSNDG